MEEDLIAHLVFSFSLMLISVLLHLTCGMGKCLPHILY